MKKEKYKMNEIKLGDTKELIKQYPDEYFDCVVSDVPYLINTGGIRKSNSEKYSKTDPSGIFNRISNRDLKRKWIKTNDDDNLTLIESGKLFAHADIEFNEWLPDVYRVLKPNTHCYLMINSRNLKNLQIEAEKVGFKFQNLLVWIKNNATPNKFYMQQTEFILMLRKGGERYINYMGTSNVFSYSNIIGNKYHPTEKPVQLMEDLIANSTKEGDIVLDPFMGSGTTCLAAKELNRRYVGFEIEQKYYDIAKQRLEKVFVPRENNEQIKLDLNT